MKKIKNNSAQATEIQHITLSHIETGNNPRKYFDEAALQELSESIKLIGIIQPVTVRKSQKEGMYTIICGERRYRASKIAGLQTIPCYLLECSDEQALDMAITENIQRENMTDLETAEIIKVLLEQNNLPYSEIAVKLGKSEKYIRDRYVLNNLIDQFKNELNENQLTIGKAVLIASYPQNIQEDLFAIHFSNKDYLYWGEFPIKKLQSLLERQFNNNLEDAEFDTAECQQCTFNSNFGLLFNTEKSICLNSNCYKEKSEIAKLNNITQVLECNPEYLICRKTYSDETIIDLLIEGNYEISEESSSYFPEEPNKPNPDKYLNDITEELNEEEFMKAQQEYEEEVKQYHNTVLEIQQKIESGEYQPCYIINGSSVENGYISNKSNDVENTSSNLEIERLQKQLTREQELKIEKTISDIKDSHFKGNVNFKNETTKFEQDVLFFYLISELSQEHRKEFFDGKDRVTEKEKYDFVLTMTKEHQIVIIRDYILSFMKKYAFDSHSVHSQLFLQFSKIHFPKETQDIEFKYQQIFEKRKQRINEKLCNLGVDTKNGNLKIEAKE